MYNLEKLMLLACWPVTDAAIAALPRNNEHHRTPSDKADDLTLCRRVMQASIDRRKLNSEDKADCSHTDELQGLRPYHCTYPSCSTGSKLYRFRSDWMEHEKVTHQQLWRCRDHHEFSCHSRDAFERHLMEEHRSLKEIHRKALMDIYKPDTDDKRRHCPICLSSTEELIDQSPAEHIAEHLEQFASRASNFKASDARLLVLQAFNASQSHHTPCFHDIQAQAPTVGLLPDKLILRTATTTAKDRIYAMLGIPNTEDGAARRLKRSKAEDGNTNAKQEAAGHGSAVDTRTQQLPFIRYNPSMLDHQPDNHPQADRDLQQTQPSWHQLDLNPPFDKPYLQIPTLSTSLSGVRSVPIWTCAKATSAAPTYFSPLSHSTQSFVDGGIKDGTPTSVTDTETMPWLHGTHSSLMTPIGTAPPAPLRRRRGSDYSNTSDPRTAEPPRGRQSRSPSHHDVQQRTRSPSPLWRCDMPDCRNRNLTRQADLRRHQHAHHSLQMLFKPPVPVIHRDSRTPLYVASSTSDHSRVLHLPGQIGHPTATGQKDRHRNSTDTGRARRATASSPIHELNPRTRRV